MPRAGLWQRPNRRRHRVFTRPRAAISILANRSQAQIMIFNRKMLEFLDSLDRGAQQRDNSATLHHLSDRFERQAAAATACSNVMIEQCNPSLASLGE